MRISTSSMYDQSTSLMAAQSISINALQSKISSGKRVSTPSDDPAAAAQILDIESARSIVAQNISNQGYANDKLGTLSNSLSSVTSLMQDARDIAMQANSPTLTSTDRKNFATTLRSMVDELMGFANTADSSGSYIFSGFQTNKPAFANVGGTVTYQGDAGVRTLAVSQSRQMPVSISGNDVFNQVQTGNGFFDVQPAAANTGTAVPQNLVVANQQALTGHNYTVSFAVAGGSTTYTVKDNATGSNVVTNQALNTNNQSIQFDGISFSLTGSPANGDTVSVTPSSTKSVFQTLTDLANSLATTTTSQAATAQVNNAVSTALREIDQGMAHMQNIQSTVGSRQKELDTLGQIATDTDTLLQTQKSRLQDLDYSSAITDLTKQETQLQAAQMSFSKISKMSLFNYL